MNDVTYRFKSIATITFFNLTIKCITSDSCLFKKKFTEALNWCTIFFLEWEGEEKILFLAVYFVWTLSFVAQVLFCVLGPNSCVNKIFKQA